MRHFESFEQVVQAKDFTVNDSVFIAKEVSDVNRFAVNINRKVSNL